MLTYCYICVVYESCWKSRKWRIKLFKKKIGKTKIKEKRTVNAHFKNHLCGAMVVLVLVVSVLAFYSDDLSLNLEKPTLFILQISILVSHWIRTVQSLVLLYAKYYQWSAGLQSRADYLNFFRILLISFTDTTYLSLNCQN